MYLVTAYYSLYRTIKLFYRVCTSQLSHPHWKPTVAGPVSQLLPWFCRHSREHSDNLRFHRCVFHRPHCQVAGLLQERSRFVFKPNKYNYQYLNSAILQDTMPMNRYNTKNAIFISFCVTTRLISAHAPRGYRVKVTEMKLQHDNMLHEMITSCCLVLTWTQSPKTLLRHVFLN